MSVQEIIELISTIGSVVFGLIAIIVSVKSGEFKKFVEDKAVEAESKIVGEKTGQTKLQYVVEEVKKKYKILSLLLNIKTIIERIIYISKKINAKDSK